MPHSLNKVWIHGVWATRDRLPLIVPGIERTVFNTLDKEFKAAGCRTKLIDGTPDHIHCLFLLNPKKALDEIIKMVKGVTSHTFNQENLIRGKFTWHKGYAAYSVSESELDKIVHHIRSQKALHLKKDFVDEIDDLLSLDKTVVRKPTA